MSQIPAGYRVSPHPLSDIRVRDLTAAARRIDADEAMSSNERMKKVSILIWKLHAQHSAKEDLQEAYDAHDWWVKLVAQATQEAHPKNWDSDPMARFLAHTLQTKAVMGYFRAFEGGAQKRKSGPFAEALNTPDLQAAHERIIEIRNTVIAHYGNQTIDDREWSQDLICVGVEPDGQWGFTYPFSRFYSRATIAQDLEDCIGAVWRRSVDWRTKLENELRKKMAKLTVEEFAFVTSVPVAMRPNTTGQEESVLWNSFHENPRVWSKPAGS